MQEMCRGSRGNEAVEVTMQEMCRGSRCNEAVEVTMQDIMKCLRSLVVWGVFVDQTFLICR